jgi:hypothetical protein
MKRIILIGALMAVMVAGCVAGCEGLGDREIAREEHASVSRSGATRSETTVVRESPSGSITTEQTKTRTAAPK